MKLNRTISIMLFLTCSLPVAGITAETLPSTDTKAVGLEQAVKPASKQDDALPVKSATPVAQKIRLGYVDVAKISSESDLGKQYKSEAKQKQQKFQGQIENRRKQLDKQKNAIEAKIASLTQAQREAKGKEFQKKVEDFQKFGLNAEKELLSFQEQLSKSMFEQVEKAAVEYGKAQGLAIVLVKQEMLYLSGDVDTTDATEGVIKIMNADGKKK